MRPLHRLVLLLLSTLLISSCTRIHFDPSGGAETVIVQSLQHQNDFDITYLRKPEEGPLSLDKNAWTVFWFVPLNHPDLGMWIEQTLPEGADAANVRSNVRMPWYGNVLFFCSIGLAKLQRIHYQMDPVIFEPTRKTEKTESLARAAR